MGALDGRVAIITGAGRGLGREHALLFASEGAKVVVNDLGGDMHGDGGDPSAAMQVVDEIKALGGEAVVNGENVADWNGAQRLVQQAVDTYGDLHVLVNNAGILRDRVIINMTEAEWDSVINVHLKGHFAPTHHAAVYWREQTKAGKEVRGVDHPHDVDLRLVRQPGPGELRRRQERHRDPLAGVREGARPLRRAVERDRARARARGSPRRRPGLGDAVKAPDEGFDVWHPGNVSPFVAYLATEGCTITGECFLVQGGKVQRAQSWKAAETVDKNERWTVEELAAEAANLVPAKAPK